MAIAGLNVMEMLRDQLKLKQLEIDSLLEITKAINSNKSSSALFELFHRTLKDQIGVENMLLFSKNGSDWEPVLGNKFISDSFLNNLLFSIATVIIFVTVCANFILSSSGS